MMRLTVVLISAFIVCCCAKPPRSSTRFVEVSVLEITPFNSVYRLKGLTENPTDTVFLISRMKKTYDQYDLKHPDKNKAQHAIEADKKYKFELQEVTRVRVSTMEQLGKYIIVHTDTLWRGPSGVVPPKYYIANNTIGLVVYE